MVQFAVTVPPLKTTPASTEWPALLLPVRLETRRVVNDLWIRIFPDQPFVDSFQEALTEEENTLGLPLSNFVRNLDAGAVPTADEVNTARGQWKELARRYGSNRAAWIVRSVADNPAATGAMSSSDAIPRLFLLPERFIVLVYEGNQLAYVAAGKDVAGNLTLLPAPTTDTPNASPEDGLFDADSKWVSDLQAAMDAGLAIKIQLVGRHRGAPVHFSEMVAVGLSAGEAPNTAALEKFLKHHHYTDGVEFLDYGTPTNNTNDAPSAHSQSEEHLAASFDFEVLSPVTSLSNLVAPQTAAARFASAVGLNESIPYLSHIRGADFVPNAGLSETLRALWGATGDYFLSKLLQYEKQVDARAMLFRHAASYLRPRGALPTVRIGNNPYGVLPVSRIKAASSADPTGWKPDPRDSPVGVASTDSVAFDTALHRALTGMLPRWLERARNTAVVPRVGSSGDPDDELLRILGMEPHSVSYRVRPIVDQTMVGFLMFLFQGVLFGPNSGFEGLVDPPQAMSAWTQQLKLVTDATIALCQQAGLSNVQSLPLLQAFAWGSGRELDMPLVIDRKATPVSRPEEYLQWLVDHQTDVTHSNTLLYDLLRRSLFPSQWPQSLGAPEKLLSALKDYPVVSFFNNNISTEGLEALAAREPLIDASGYDLEALSHKLNDDRPPQGFASTDEVKNTMGSWRVALFENFRIKLHRDFEDHLDAGLRDIIDALTYRLDAWYSTLATKRLEAMQRVVRPTGVHWGAYGYLEDLSLDAGTKSRGLPSTGGGFIQAPSVAQASAAALLRSAFDSHRDDPDGNPYGVNLTSRRVSRALALIDGVQQGQDLPALLGYQFERGLHDVGLDRLIDDFRTAFPLVAPDEGPDAPEEIVAPRNVCDGRQLAEAFAAADRKITDLIAPLSADDQKTIRSVLSDLGDATDAVGDLLLFEGIFQAVQGNYERSGSALDACAGAGRPPEIESVTTYVSGTNLRHRVCLVLADESVAGPGARALAEPRLNAWAGNIIGSLNQIGCRVYVTRKSEVTQENVVEDFDVRLDQLSPSISALDFVHMCSALPTGTGESEIEIRIKRVVTSLHPNTADAAFQVALTEPPIDEPTGARPLEQAMELGRAILDLLGNVTTIAPAGLLHAADVPAGPMFANEDVQDLKDRANAARQLLSDQIEDLGSPDSAIVLRALDICAGFGIQEAIAGETAPSSIFERAAAALPIVQKRSNGAGLQIDAVNAASGGDERIQALLSACKVLFGESFVVLPVFKVPTGDARFAAFDGSMVGAAPSEERIWLWLQQVTETHPRVRSLETVLMHAEAWGHLRYLHGFPVPRIAQLPFRPEYGWQALADSELIGTAGRARGCQSIVAMMPPAGIPESVTGFIIEDWTETLPASEVTTGLSFEYDQPAQQAPQSLLLAVPGNFDSQVWTADHLAGIVRDTMDLARARLVDLDALPSVAGILPALLFPITVKGRPLAVPTLLGS